MAMEPTHYVHVKSGGAVLVKAAPCFVTQGGLWQAWGKDWRPVVADSVEDARLKAAALFHVEASRLYWAEP